MRLTWQLFPIFILILNGTPSRAQSQQVDSGNSAPAELDFRIESSEELALPSINFSAVRMTSDGTLLFLASDRWALHRIQPGSPAKSFRLHGLPELSSADVQLSPSLAVDKKLRVYIPGVLSEWKRGATPRAAVFVFDESGRPLQTIALSPRMHPRQVALDEAGNLIVLGFASREGECMFLHRFAPDGTRLGSFSPCPHGLSPASPDLNERRSAFLRLWGEIWEGLLWSGQGRIYHVLPGARLLRIFDGEGALIREVTFLPPESSRLLAQRGMRADPAGDRIRRVVPLPDGKYLVEWLHIEAVGKAGQHRVTFLALHDSQGQPVTQAAHPAPARPSYPLQCDADGRVVFLHLTREGGEKVHLVRASVALHPPA